MVMTTINDNASTMSSGGGQLMRGKIVCAGCAGNLPMGVV
jgi:hypothetical protein